jgi:hypothetical protein
VTDNNPSLKPSALFMKIAGWAIMRVVPSAEHKVGGEALTVVHAGPVMSRERTVIQDANAVPKDVNIPITIAAYRSTPLSLRLHPDLRASAALTVAIIRTAFRSIFRLMRMPAFIQAELFGRTVCCTYENTCIGGK